ncbi:MAG: hypothetical protein IPK78_12165 [Rhodospirillales bacterium]|nr:hypothetical protein [Rhodospirillales bacterium]
MLVRTQQKPRASKTATNISEFLGLAAIDWPPVVAPAASFTSPKLPGEPKDDCGAPSAGATTSLADGSTANEELIRVTSSINKMAATAVVLFFILFATNII